MARPLPSHTIQPKGTIEFVHVKPDRYRALFTPPAEAMTIRNSDPAQFKTPIFDIDHGTSLLSIFPYRVWGVLPMKPRYLILDRIDIELEKHYYSYVPNVADILEFLEDVLPSGFVSDFHYGLGLRKDCDPIVSLLQQFDVETLHVSTKGPALLDVGNKRVVLNRSDLDRMVRMIGSVTQKARKAALSVKKNELTKAFADLVTNKSSERLGKPPGVDIKDLLPKSARTATKSELVKKQREAIDLVRENGKAILKEQPKQLMKLRNDIDLVTLEELIERYSEMLTKKLPESRWQELFNENPFILSMAFGVPIIKTRGLASVGGIKLSGSGNKISDFLVKNRISNNASIIEIKTPDTQLIAAKEYRGGVFAPSVEMTAAITQILDQIYQFQKDISTLKNNSKEYDLESYSVLGILIAGRSMKNLDMQKAFELFRGNSKNAQIITFDELLMKLRNLHSFLSSSEESKIRTEPAEAYDLISKELPF